MMSTRLVGALVLLLAVYTYALPIQESSHELHETGDTPAAAAAAAPSRLTALWC